MFMDAAGKAAETVADSGSVAPTNSFLSSPWASVIMIVLLIAAFYFLLIRPQRKQEKEAAELRNSIKVGDEIVTIGGIIGTVVIIRDDKMMIETGNDQRPFHHIPYHFSVHLRFLLKYKNSRLSFVTWICGNDLVYERLRIFFVRKNTHSNDTKHNRYNC